MKALVIVHLSSLDAFAKHAGIAAAFALAARLKRAILAWKGLIYVIDQRWPIRDESEPRWKLVNEVQLQKDIRWIHFDDDEQDWEIFLRHFRAELIRAGVKDVVLGGVWFHPGTSAGSVSEVYRALRKHMRVQVNQDLVGVWSEAS